MGNTEFHDYSVREVVVSAPPIEQEKAVELACQQRPDIRAQQLRVKSAEALVANNQLQYWPTLNASASYSWSDKYFLPTPYNWNVGLTLNVPIFNEPQLSAQVRQSEATLRQNQAQLESVTLAGRQAVTEAWLNLREPEQRSRLSLPALASAQENFRLASERYQVGVGASLDVSDAQRVLVLARSQELQARFDVQLAIVKLHHEVGDLTLDLMLGAYPAATFPSSGAMPPPEPRGVNTLLVTTSPSRRPLFRAPNPTSDSVSVEQEP